MVAAGGTVVFPIGDTERGRGGRIEDPFGHVWMLSQRTDEGAMAGEAAPGGAPEGEGPDIGALSDLCTPWCIRVVATLGIADLIAAGTTDIDGLAAAARCDSYALHRVLTYLVGRGVFGEISPGRFALNGAARGLLDPSMRRFDLDIEGIGGRFAYAWGTLLTYVRTGAPAYREVFGLPYWEDLAAHPDIGASFDALMGPEGHGTPDPLFDLADGWGSVRTVVDVGGGTGAMLAEILRARPQVHGTLVDLPATVERSREIFLAAGVADRVDTVGQSCLDPLPAGSDLYLLRGVLNDWPDPEATDILRRCAEAARPNGRVVVMKGVAPDDSPRPLTIEMVLLGGKHRTVSEFRRLAGYAGLDVVAAGRQPSGSFVVECRPR
jgi:SAM-dependent methyltransferase